MTAVPGRQFAVSEAAAGLSMNPPCGGCSVVEAGPCDDATGLLVCAVCARPGVGAIKAAMQNMIKPIANVLAVVGKLSRCT
jgi:hypothetical protein